jgi:hypothetical protein
MAARQLAEVSDYDGLIVALRSRADELQVARETNRRNLRPCPRATAARS